MSQYTVCGKKSFLSKESDTKTLQSIHFTHDVGIMSSVVEDKLTSITFRTIYLSLNWITYEFCSHNYTSPWANQKESWTDDPRHNSNINSPFDQVHSSIVATNSSLRLYVA